MSLYYFDLIDGGLNLDNEGLEFATAAEAQREALRSLPDMAKELLGTKEEHEVSITMRNERGVPVFEATLTIEARWLGGHSPQ